MGYYRKFMSKESVLQNFGLTAAEIKVYITLLQAEATASEIAKKTGTNRTFTYDRLKKLSDIGLVSLVWVILNPQLSYSD